MALLFFNFFGVWFRQWRTLKKQETVQVSSTARKKDSGCAGEKFGVPHLFSLQNQVFSTSVYLHQNITRHYSPWSYLQAGFGDMPKYFNQPVSAHHPLTADITLITRAEESSPFSTFSANAIMKILLQRRIAHKITCLGLFWN